MNRLPHLFGLPSGQWRSRREFLASAGLGCGSLAMTWPRHLWSEAELTQHCPAILAIDLLAAGRTHDGGVQMHGNVEAACRGDKIGLIVGDALS